MRTWAAILHATSKRGGTALHVIFVSAFTIEEAHEKGVKACKTTFPESKGYKEHVAIVRNVQEMYDEVSRVQKWDYDET